MLDKTCKITCTRRTATAIIYNAFCTSIGGTQLLSVLIPAFELTIGTPAVCGHCYAPQIPKNAHHGLLTYRLPQSCSICCATASTSKTNQDLQSTRHTFRQGSVRGHCWKCIYQFSSQVFGCAALSFPWGLYIQKGTLSADVMSPIFALIKAGTSKYGGHTSLVAVRLQKLGSSGANLAFPDKSF